MHTASAGSVTAHCDTSFSRVLASPDTDMGDNRERNAKTLIEKQTLFCEDKIFVFKNPFTKSITFPRIGIGKCVARACFVNNALVVYLLYQVSVSGNAVRKIGAKNEQTRSNPGQLADCV
ncbi:hypothetical protein T11_3427 [Trichinella zimbabwensis]|uniref:Uncharacterized protein n=1 Tax=Trichinella zimbabwensis TaxID=268475 RepID=A0A0V1I633_9BILA|nr:hypothetical protein T11_3427 [Trichinella zimbabwensis]